MTLEGKEVTITIFLDIKGGLDNATTNSPIEPLQRKGVTPELLQLIIAILKKWLITSTINEATIIVEAGAGCPQGGVLYL